MPLLSEGSEIRCFEIGVTCVALEVSSELIAINMDFV